MTCEAGTSHREENAKKKRNRRNAWDLVGHILSVVMEVLILTSLNIQSLIISHHSKIINKAVALSVNRIYCYCQVLSSKHSATQVMKLSGHSASRILTFPSYIGSMTLQYLSIVYEADTSSRQKNYSQPCLIP